MPTGMAFAGHREYRSTYSTKSASSKSPSSKKSSTKESSVGVSASTLASSVVPEHSTPYCSICEVEFTEQRALTRHFETKKHQKRLGNSNGLRTYKCERLDDDDGQCTKEFTRPSDLARHEREVHDGVKRRKFEEALRSAQIQEPADSALVESEQNRDEPMNDTLRGISKDVEVVAQLADCRLEDAEHVDLQDALDKADLYKTDLEEVIVKSGQGLGASRACVEECPECAQLYVEPSRLIACMFRHMSEWDNKDVSERRIHRCKACDLGFVKASHLSRHLRNAMNGHCGYKFIHGDQGCTGHHPPAPAPDDGISLHDRLERAYVSGLYMVAKKRALEAKVPVVHRQLERRLTLSEQIGVETRRLRGTPYSPLKQVAVVHPKAASLSQISTTVSRFTEFAMDQAKARVVQTIRRALPGKFSPAVVVAEDPSEEEKQERLKQAARDQLLYEAILKNDRSKVRQLLSSKEVNANFYVQDGDHKGLSALALALNFGHESIAQQLLEAGADMNFESAPGLEKHFRLKDVNLTSAVVNRSLTSIKILLANGRSLDQCYGDKSPLYAAAELGNRPLLGFLLDFGALVDYDGGPYGTALCAAAARGDEPCASWLLDHDKSSGRPPANPNLVIGQYGCALGCAAAHNQREMISLLLSKGALVDGPRGVAMTPLQHARSWDQAKSLLLLNHARPSIPADVEDSDTEGEDG